MDARESASLIATGGNQGNAATGETPMDAPPRATGAADSKSNGDGNQGERLDTSRESLATAASRDSPGSDVSVTFAGGRQSREQTPSIVCEVVVDTVDGEGEGVEEECSSLLSSPERVALNNIHQTSVDSKGLPDDGKHFLSPAGSRPPSECDDSHSGRGGTCFVSAPTSLSRRSSCSSQMRHRIMFEEVAPSASSIIEERQRSWKMSLHQFTTKKHGKPAEDKNLPRRIKRYYRTQDELINAFEELQLDVEDAMDNAEDVTKLRRTAAILSKVTFVVNLLLLIGKAVAAGLTGSLAVISSVVDSGVDLVSGALMWWSNRAIRKRDVYQYPQGRTKLEPVAIVIVAVVMASASVQIIRESIENIIEFATTDKAGVVFEVASIVICSLTVVIKLVMFLVCRRVKNPSIQTLAADHRNDVISNSGALACGLIGYYFWKYMDPVGAIAISIYIIVSWCITGWEQIKMLTGHTARPEFLKKLTWISLNHHPEVLLIDTVRAFHFGNNFLVEVDIVLPEEMNLRQAHDIGETLQLKLERLTEVERAFVHLDYECEHSPFSEHKYV